MKRVITITIGEHADADEFVDELLGEISWTIDDTEIEGVPVTYGVLDNDTVAKATELLRALNHSTPRVIGNHTRTLVDLVGPIFGVNPS